MTLDDIFERSMPIPHAGCWIWMGRESTRYGSFSLKGKIYAAHRYVWTLVNGPIPGGMCICHRCDTPFCVNPGHLFLGTQAENAADMVRKGRVARGERSARAKVSERDVHNIREMAASGISSRQISVKFKLSVGQIQNIINRKSWAHI